MAVTSSDDIQRWQLTPDGLMSRIRGTSKSQPVKAVLLDNLRTLDIVRPTSASNIALDRVGNIKETLLARSCGCCMTRHFRLVMCTYAADEGEHEAHET
ncbi:hypothetical protein E4U47_004794 [Claviceps purpurea]|nr:hypothetical protein E4U27_006454 [Claviceps purpurea]KAG6194351.1 hypothetical protein E4U10_003016 [Claviceps purpurea]KAG6257540.1 hypothetical protein E4U23_003905 [Claviceps purpurea]KAG6265944.1 hypothetical protein E4U49_000666 [Claviceps purpurea]KAG6268251.1 hypothetical protein E4U47_004794 [Claviceps purpurea]